MEGLFPLSMWGGGKVDVVTSIHRVFLLFFFLFFSSFVGDFFLQKRTFGLASKEGPSLPWIDIGKTGLYTPLQCPPLFFFFLSLLDSPSRDHSWRDAGYWHCPAGRAINRNSISCSGLGTDIDGVHFLL